MKFNLDKKSFTHIYKAFEKYCEKRILFGIFLTIISLCISVITLILPDISISLHEYIYYILICLIVLIIIFLYHFHMWKQNNYFTTEVTMESMIIIDGKYDNKLTFKIYHLIVPSEDTLFQFV